MKCKRFLSLGLVVLLLLTTCCYAAEGSSEGIADYGFMSEGAVITSLRNVTSVNAYVKVSDWTSLGTAVMVLSVYQNGRLDDFTITPVEDAGSNTVVSKAVEVANSSTTVKVMLLENLDNLRPLAEVKALYSASKLTSEMVEDVTDEGDYILLKYRETPSDRFQQSFRIGKNPTVYCNGVLQDGFVANVQRLLSSFYGFVVLDNPKPGTVYDYDTLYITTYKNLVVDKNTPSVGRITAKNTAASITYKSNDMSIKATLYDADGQRMDWEDLQEWDVLSYTEAETASQIIYTAWKIENQVTGRVWTTLYEGTSDVMFGIGETDNCPEYALDNILSYDEISLGDEGVFYLDILGNIAWYKLTNTNLGNYGYVFKAMCWTGFNSTLQLRLFQQDGTFQNYFLSSKVKINGITCKINSFSEAEIDTLADELEGRLIRFQVNEKGEISAYDTAKLIGTKNEFTQYGGKEYQAATYNKAIKSFKPAGASPVFAADDILIFYTPQGSYFSEQDYEILNLSNIADDQDFQYISFYNVNDNQETNIILIKGEYAPIVGDNTISVSQTIRSLCNSNNEVVCKLTALKDGEPIDYVTDAKLGYGEIPSIGSAFIPVKLHGINTVQKFAYLTEVDYDRVSLGSGAMHMDDNVYYMGNILKINNRIITLEDESMIYVPDTANIYVYDNRLNQRYALHEGYLDEILVTYDPKTGRVVYEDMGAEITDYVAFAREYRGVITDVILYINLEYIQPSPLQTPVSTPELTVSPVPEP